MLTTRLALRIAVAALCVVVATAFMFLLQTGWPALEQQPADPNAESSSHTESIPEQCDDPELGKSAFGSIVVKPAVTSVEEGSNFDLVLTIFNSGPCEEPNLCVPSEYFGTFGYRIREIGAAREEVSSLSYDLSLAVVDVVRGCAKSQLGRIMIHAHQTIRHRLDR